MTPYKSDKAIGHVAVLLKDEWRESVLEHTDINERLNLHRKRGEVGDCNESYAGTGDRTEVGEYESFKNGRKSW